MGPQLGVPQEGHHGRDSNLRRRHHWPPGGTPNFIWHYDSYTRYWVGEKDMTECSIVIVCVTHHTRITNHVIQNSRDWRKSIENILFYITIYNSFAPSPRNVTKLEPVLAIFITSFILY